MASEKDEPMVCMIERDGKRIYRIHIPSLLNAEYAPSPEDVARAKKYCRA